MDLRPRLLIVDDDRELRAMLAAYLEGEGFRIEIAASGAQALELLRTARPDLLVLDVMLPGASGFDVLRTLRSARSLVPVLMLTAHGDDVDRILGLELGADDYMAKPFNPRELAARIRAILRRIAPQDAGPAASHTAGPIHLDGGTRQVTVEGAPVELTPVEYRILELLLVEAGRVVSRERLAEQGLGRRLELYDRAVDTHVSNLRRKLAPAQPGAEIRTVRGAGYLLTTAASST